MWPNNERSRSPWLPMGSGRLPMVLSWCALGRWWCLGLLAFLPPIPGCIMLRFIRGSCRFRPVTCFVPILLTVKTLSMCPVLLAMIFMILSAALPTYLTFAQATSSASPQTSNAIAFSSPPTLWTFLISPRSYTYVTWTPESPCTQHPLLNSRTHKKTSSCPGSLSLVSIGKVVC